MHQREREAREKDRKARLSQQWVPLSQVSRHLLHAVLASEDQNFFGHEGVDWKALRESVEDNVERGRLSRGGSTITQQLAKNLYFGTRQTPVRKARELVVTRWLEEDLSKARILALYVNVIEWGDGVYGCEAAARHWYGKPASSLTTAEAAGLAAMIPNPRRINPRVSPTRYERARAGCCGSWSAPATSDATWPGSGRRPRRRARAPGSSPRPRARTGPRPDERGTPSGCTIVGMKLASPLVGDYMTRIPIVVEPEDSLMQALEIIRLRGVRRLPVTVGGMLVGLVTEGDLKRAEPSMLTDSEADFNRVMEETPVSRIMIQNPVTTTADVSLLEAAETLSAPSTGRCRW